MPEPGGKTPPTDRTTVRQQAQQGIYDREVIYGILDEALICHVGFVDGGQPYVIPTIHVRVGDRLCIHGSPTARSIRCLGEGHPACITVTLLDGLVLARSALHHSMNYRSVVVLGTATEVTDRLKKMEALRALVEQVATGRWNDVGKPGDRDLDATTVLSFPLNEVSAKIRRGPPGDEEDDYTLPVWAGVVPLALTPGKAIADPRLSAGVDVPAYVSGYRRPEWST